MWWGVIAATPRVHRASRIGGQQHHHREGIDGRLDESVVLIEALRDFVLGVNEEEAYPYRRRDFHCLEDEMLEKSRPELTFRTSDGPFTSPTLRLARRVGSRRLRALRQAL